MSALNTDKISALLDEFSPEEVPIERRIFVNRNLRMNSIEFFGFDMDYTLAEYTTAFEVLQVQMTVERLVKNLGYPKALADLPYDPEFAIRGLIIDKRHGNILKADSHRHIVKALHGDAELQKDERRALYRHERVRMKSDRYALVDTLFAVPETWLFSKLVEMEDAKGQKRVRADRYGTIFEDVRKTIDTIHADESLKSIVMADIGTYIHRDPELPRTLVRLRNAGKRLFLLTNSLGNYTQAVMSHLLDGLRTDRPDWRQYFDIIGVGSRKPAFFETTEPFKRLDDRFQPTAAKVRSFEHGAMYHAGNRADFERFLGDGGDHVLYVGDNMYGDIMRSKALTSWRTAMIVPELETELLRISALRETLVRREELDTLRRQLDSEIHHQEHMLSGLRGLAREPTVVNSDDVDVQPPSPVDARPGLDRTSVKQAIAQAQKQLKSREKQLQSTLQRIHEINTEVARAFNPRFGMVFKCHDEHSIFGEQLEDYACLYTSRVVNFSKVSPFQYFRAPHDFLPHEVPPLPRRIG